MMVFLFEFIQTFTNINVPKLAKSTKNFGNLFHLTDLLLTFAKMYLILCIREAPRKFYAAILIELFRLMPLSLSLISLGISLIPFIRIFCVRLLKVLFWLIY